MFPGPRQSLVIWVPLWFPLFTERKTVKKLEPSEGLDMSDCLPSQVGLSNSSICRYRVHRHHCSYKEQAIVQRFQRVILVGFQGKNREVLAFQLKILCLFSQPLCWVLATPVLTIVTQQSCFLKEHHEG